MNTNELSKEFVKIAERLQEVVESLEKYAEQQEPKKDLERKSDFTKEGSDFGVLSNSKGGGMDPTSKFLDFVFS